MPRQGGIQPSLFPSKQKQRIRLHVGVTKMSIRLENRKHEIVRGIGETGVSFPKKSQEKESQEEEPQEKVVSRKERRKDPIGALHQTRMCLGCIRENRVHLQNPSVCLGKRVTLENCRH